MDMVSSTGLTKLYTKDNTNVEKNMEKVCFYGRMIAHMRASFFKTIFMDSVSILGKMGVFIKENGKIIKCKAKEYLHGLMDADMKVNIKMIRNKA